VKLPAHAHNDRVDQTAPQMHGGVALREARARLRRPSNILEQMPKTAAVLEEMRQNLGFGPEWLNKRVREGWQRGATAKFWMLEGWFVVGFPPDEALYAHLNRLLSEEVQADCHAAAGEPVPAQGGSGGGVAAPTLRAAPQGGD
jgi:hypothetical protein